MRPTESEENPRYLTSGEDKDWLLHGCCGRFWGAVATQQLAPLVERESRTFLGTEAGTEFHVAVAAGGGLPDSERGEDWDEDHDVVFALSNRFRTERSAWGASACNTANPQSVQLVRRAPAAS